MGLPLLKRVGLADWLPPEAVRVHDALLTALPASRHCSICGSIDKSGRKAAPIEPALGHVEVCGGRDVDAAVFTCDLCHSVETVPLQKLARVD